jgi:hypothetical protein
MKKCTLIFYVIFLKNYHHLLLEVAASSWSIKQEKIAFNWILNVGLQIFFATDF